MSKSILDHSFPPEIGNLYDEDLANQLAETQGAVGSLLQTSRLLQNPNLLMRPILGKEAESSSQLEGTQASIEDAYQIGITEQTEDQENEAQEIVNYEKAMHKGLEALTKYGLNEMTIREVHRTLMQGVRGKDKSPGQYRKEEVWIGKQGTGKGKARYLPPDPLHVPKLMEQLVSLMNNRKKMNPLIACAVIHHRFEAIHPFKDGNGRVGRLLITLYLVKEGLLTMPILYPSGFFEEHKGQYMDALSQVDKKEDWYPWLMFFLHGIQEQAELSLKLVLDIDGLYKRCRSLIEQESASLNLIKLLEYSFAQPYLTAPIAHSATGIPLSTTKRYLNLLEQKGILRNPYTYKKQKVFVNHRLVGILRSI